MLISQHLSPSSPLPSPSPLSTTRPRSVYLYPSHPSIRRYLFMSIQPSATTLERLPFIKSQLKHQSYEGIYNGRPAQKTCPNLLRINSEFMTTKLNERVQVPLRFTEKIKAKENKNLISLLFVSQACTGPKAQLKTQNVKTPSCI